MTVTDNQILTAVADLTAQKGYPPTFRELGDRVGLSSTGSAFRRCAHLAEAGLLEPCGTKRARGIRLTLAGADLLFGGKRPPAIATAPRVQRVPVLRTSASLAHYLEMPTHRERVTSSAALASQPVEILTLTQNLMMENLRTGGRP